MFFSTHSIQRASRCDAWMAAINDHCGPFVTRFNSDFEGSIDARRVGGLDCARITQTSRETFRTAHEIARGDPDTFFVILQVSGRSSLEQAGRTAMMTPGDVTIIDSAIASRFRFEQKNIQLSLHIPRHRLERPDVVWPDHVATTLPRAAAVLVGTLLRSSFEHVCGSNPIQERAVADALIGLIAAGWQLPSVPNEDHDLPPDEATTLIRSVKDYVIGHLDSETLSPSTIARAHRISERQLHRIFQAPGLSICRWIRQSRLDRCAADLRDAAERGRTITEIAFRWGFNDAAHFSRLFRAEYGVAPSEYRSEAIARLQSAAG